MDLLRLIPIAAQVSVFVSVFGFGLRAGPQDVLYLLRRPRLLGLSLLSMFVVMPVFALVLVLVFERSPAVAIAVSTLALSPVPPLLPRTEDQAEADTSYGFGLMVTVALLSILIVPALVGFLGRIMGLQFVYPAQTVMIEMLRVVVLPVILGLLLNRLAPQLAERLKEPITRITRLLLGRWGSSC